MSRRRLMQALALLSLAAAGMQSACTTTTDANGNTVTTVNVAKFVSYANVAISAINTILSIAGVSSVLGATAVGVLNKALTALQAVLNDFSAACSGTLTFTASDKSIWDKATSVLAAMKTVLSYLKSSVAGLSGSIGTNDLANVNAAVNAAETAVALTTTLLGLFSAEPDAPRVLMSERKMFAAVRMRVPDWAAE